MKLAIDAISSVVMDLSNAGESVDYVEGFAKMATALILSVNAEAATDDLRSFVFDRAKSVRAFLKKRTEYMAVPAIQRAVADLNGFIALDTSGTVSMQDLMDKANDFIECGNYAAVKEMIPRLLEGSHDYDRITIESIEVIAQLYLEEFDAAGAGIDKLLAFQMHQDYMATPLMQGLGKIHQALTALTTKLPPALSARIKPVYDRTMQLWDLVDKRSSR
jgi:hypothetical protein